MRTLALAIGVSLCLGTSAAQALCTTGADCIRERFGVDRTVTNNRIVDRTDRLGDRGRPLNPYLAGQNVANQARRAGRFDATGIAGGRYGADPTQGREIRPDVRYTPSTAFDPYAPGAPISGETPSETEALSVAPYEPVQPATGAPSAAPRIAPSVGARSAPAGQRDRNTPQGSAEVRYTGPQSTGATR